MQKEGNGAGTSCRQVVDKYSSTVYPQPVHVIPQGFSTGFDSLR